MPNAALNVCRQPGCGDRCVGGYCEKHRRKNVTQGARAQFDKQRGSAHKRGYDAAWKRQSRRVLMRDPFCKIGKPDDTRASSCRGFGLSTVVDHVVPGHGGRRVTDEELQGACKSDHDWKTATQDSTFAVSLARRNRQIQKG